MLTMSAWLEIQVRGSHACLMVSFGLESISGVDCSLAGANGAITKLLRTKFNSVRITMNYDI